MATLTVHVPAGLKSSAGARWTAAAFARVVQLIETLRKARAVPCSRDATDDDVARVRRYAQSVMAQDPRFAADLFAAADRHEREEMAGR